MSTFDDDLIDAWNGDETFAEIGRQLGISRSAVRRAFERLKRQGRISDSLRPRHFTRETDISELRDPLLDKLRKVHGTPG